MRDDLNPYAPPNSIAAPVGFWERFLNFFGVRSSHIERIRRGAYFGHYGVRFRLQPDDDAHVFAFVPWTNTDERRAELNVLEARRCLTYIITRHTEMQELIAGRKLVVVLVPSYAEFDDELRRVEIPAPDWELDPNSREDDFPSGA